jgi:hypothetical protein
MSNEQKLNVEIEVTSDTRGAQEAKQAVQSVAAESKQAAQATRDQGKSAEEASKANEKAAKGVNELGEGFEKGAAAGRVLSEAMRGNVLALTQLAPAIKALAALIKTNLIGVLFTLGAVAAQFLVPMIKGFMDARGAAEEAAKGFGKAKESLDDLAKKRDLKLAAQLDEIKIKTDAAVAALQTLRTIRDAEADAGEAVSLAEIRANDQLTAVEKLKAEQRIRSAYATKRAQNAELEYQAEMQKAQADVDSAAASKDSKSGTVSDIEGRLAFAKSAPELKKQLDSLFGQFADVSSAMAAQRSLGADSMDSVRGQELEMQYAALSEAIEAQKQALKEASSIDIADTEKKLESAKQDQIKAVREATAAESQRAATAARIDAQRSIAKIKSGAEETISGIDIKTETKKQQITDRATAEDRKKAEEEIRKNRAAREAAAQARAQETGSYYYTDDEIAAQKKELEDFDKKFPKQTKAPSKPTPSVPKKPAGYEMVDGVMRPVGAAEDPEMEQGADGIWRKKGTKPTTLDPNKIRRTPAAPSAQPAAAQPAGQSGQPDLAGPLNEAAQKAGDSATQSADSIAAAAEAAKAVADNTKPVDASGLTTALQAAATAQQTASTQTATGIQQLVSLAEQQTALAREQAAKIATMATQVNSLRVEVGQLRAQVRNAA